MEVRPNSRVMKYGENIKATSFTCGKVLLVEGKKELLKTESSEALNYKLKHCIWYLFIRFLPDDPIT